MLDMLFIFILKKIPFMKHTHTVYKIKLHIEIQPTRNKYTSLFQQLIIMRHSNWLIFAI